MSNASWSQAPPEAASTQDESQAALRESEKRFRAFVTAAPTWSTAWSRVLAMIA